MTEQNNAVVEPSAGLSPALELHWPASTLWPAQRLTELVDLDQYEPALALNAAVAAEVPFVGSVERWFLKQFEGWNDLTVNRARSHWANAKRDAPELRELAEVGVRAYAKSLSKPAADKLAALSGRLAGAKPKIKEAGERLAALRTRLEAVNPKPKVELGVAAEPREAKREKPAAVFALPGVAGEIQDYFLRTAMQPSEIMSLAVGLMVPTALVCANVIGPSGPEGCAVQQTLVVLAPTASGKQWAIDVAKDCLRKAGAQKMLGPNRFKSGPALVRWVKENRVSLCVQDEFGRLLMKLANPKSNPCEIEINERMREFWALGPNSIYNSPVGAAKGDDMETIEGARLNILGFGVREEFFGACEGDDIANGFLNRMAIFEEAKMIRPRADFEVRDFPFSLMESLNKLVGIKTQRLGWSAGAKALYDAEVERVFITETDDRKRKLWARSPLKIAKTATVFATCRLAPLIELRDMELAQKLMGLSDQVFTLGIDEADKKKQLGHAELKREIARRLAADFDGEASLSEIKKSFKHNTKHKAAIDDAVDDMKDSDMVEYLHVKTGGKPKWVYRLKND